MSIDSFSSGGTRVELRRDWGTGKGLMVQLPKEGPLCPTHECGWIHGVSHSKAQQVCEADPADEGKQVQYLRDSNFGDVIAIVLRLHVGEAVFETLHFGFKSTYKFGGQDRGQGEKCVSASSAGRRISGWGNHLSHPRKGARHGGAEKQKGDRSHIEGRGSVGYPRGDPFQSSS